MTKLTRGVNFNFDEFPTLLEFAKSAAYIKVVIGPAGSAKTSGLIALLLWMAMQQHPGHDGVRRVRTAVIRQSYQQLAKNTLTSIRTILGGVMGVTDGKPPTGFASIPLPDGTTLEWELVFYALEAPNAMTDALGAEFTNALFDEVSSMQDEELVKTFISRMGRYPSEILGPRNMEIVRALGATNGPLKAHWLYEWFMGKHDELFTAIGKEIGRPYFELFMQPEALVQLPDGSYAPNPKAENVKNLPGGFGYYFAQLARSAQDITAYVMGRFADLAAGKVVYPTFRPEYHVVKRESFMQRWGGAGRLLLSFDFGRTPVCLVAVERSGGGLVVIDEFMAEDVAISTLWDNVCLPALRDKYPRCLYGMDGYVTGDPAGADRSQAVELSPYEVLHERNVAVEFPGDNRKDVLQPRIDAVRDRLSRLDGVIGEPMLQITDNCKYLIESLSSTYVYEEITGAKGRYSETPTKTHKHWASDLANALEYLCLYKRQDLGRTGLPPPPKQAASPLLGG